MATVRTQAQIQSDITTWTNTLNTRKTAKVACANSKYKWYVNADDRTNNPVKYSNWLTELAPGRVNWGSNCGAKLAFGGVAGNPKATLTKNNITMVFNSAIGEYVWERNANGKATDKSWGYTIDAVITCKTCGAVLKTNRTKSNWQALDGGDNQYDDAAYYKAASLNHNQVLQYTDAQRTEAQNKINTYTSELNEAKQRDTAITNFNNLNPTVTNKTQLTTLKTYLDQIATYSGANSTIHNEYNTKYLTTTNKLDVAASVSGVLDKLKINQNDVIPKLALKYNEAYNTGLVNYSECKNVIGVLTDY